MSSAVKLQGQKTKKVSASPPKKHKWYIGILVILGVLIAAVTVFLVVRGAIVGERRGMEAYLNDKYAQTFTVTGRLQERAVGIDMPGQVVGTAHPVDDDSIVFEVGKDRSTGVYFDGYSGAVWAKQERPRVESFLEEVFAPSAVPDFDVKTHIVTAAAPDPIRGKVPPIDEAILQYKDEFYYSITIRLTTPDELSASEIDDHEEKIKQIVRFILAKEVSYPMIRYAVNSEQQDASYLCNLSQDKLLDEGRIDNCLTKQNGKVW